MLISIEDMIGKRRGIITIVKYVRSVKRKGRIFLCRCDCGKEIEKTVRNFNRSDSCGCVVGGGINDKRTIDMVGKKFNALEVLRMADKFEVLSGAKTVKKEVYWKCKCDCGKEIIARGCDLRSGVIKSCNCQRPELVAINSRKYDPWYSSAKSIYYLYSDGDLSIEKFLELAKMNCYYCGEKPSNKFNVFKNKRRKSTKFSIENGDYIYSGLDRIDSKSPHNKNNVVPCCTQCNVAKSKHTLKDFKEWIIKTYSYYILNNKKCALSQNEFIFYEPPSNDGKFRKFHPSETSARRTYNRYCDGNLSFSQFVKLSQLNCYYCGCLPSNNFNYLKSQTNALPFSIENGNFNYNGLDRINPNLGHNENNIVPCCHKCNTAKLDYSQEEFKEWLTKLYNNFIKH